MNIKDCCPDCAVLEGEFHKDNCDWEKCNVCGRQVLAWGRCDESKREPFFSEKPLRCERCDKELCDFPAMMADKDWKFICGGTYPLDCVLCQDCIDFIKKIRENKNE